jgi:hypothetical protein
VPWKKAKEDCESMCAVLFFYSQGVYPLLMKKKNGGQVRKYGHSKGTMKHTIPFLFLM